MSYLQALLCSSSGRTVGLVADDRGNSEDDCGCHVVRVQVDDRASDAKHVEKEVEDRRGNVRSGVQSPHG